MRILLVLLLLLPALASAAPKSVRVFIALCDNKTQGIVPVGEKIGNGDKPDDNLYWGCSDGFGTHFKRSKSWKLTEAKSDVSKDILRRMKLTHVGGDLSITADAYRGSAIRSCLVAFEMATAAGRHDLVAFIGHNGLMDFQLPEQKAVKGAKCDAIVLCCLSDRYFRTRLERLGCRPVLTTTQLMYPGSFILHDALESWRKGGSLTVIRSAAGKAYARNQKISVRAATGVFAKPVAPAR